MKANVGHGLKDPLILTLEKCEDLRYALRLSLLPMKESLDQAQSG